jgi:hypothetical protein
MDDRSLSTNSDIIYIIKSGHVTQSAFSEAFINRVGREMNVEIVACYAQTSEFNIFRKGKPTNDFVDEVLITLFVRESSRKAIQAVCKFDDAIEVIFWETAQSLGMQWSYKRVYFPEELAYYGFSNTPRWKWDMKKIPLPIHPPRKNFVLKVEDFDSLALYHMLSAKVTLVGKYIFQVSGCNAKVYVGFLKSPPYLATHYIVFDTQNEYDRFLSLASPNAINADIQKFLQPYDPWKVLDIWPYSPQYQVWSKLNDEEKVCLLREAHE